MFLYISSTSQHSLSQQVQHVYSKSEHVQASLLSMSQQVSVCPCKYQHVQASDTQVTHSCVLPLSIITPMDSWAKIIVLPPVSFNKSFQRQLKMLMFNTSSSKTSLAKLIPHKKRHKFEQNCDTRRSLFDIQKLGAFSGKKIF